MRAAKSSDGEGKTVTFHRLRRIVLIAILLCAAALVGLLVGRSQMRMSALQGGQFETLVRDYLRKNPAVLREALADLDRSQKQNQEQRQAKAIEDNAAALFDSPHQAILGNPDGKSIMVEFFDYNCAFCKKSLDDVARLLKNESDLRIELRDFPILGPGSVEAAKVATALRNQFSGEKFWEYHYRLLGTRGPVDKDRALVVARDLGADMDELAKDVASAAAEQAINETMKLAEKLQVSGTPSFIIGHRIVTGAVGYNELSTELDNMHKCGHADCV